MDASGLPRICDRLITVTVKFSNLLPIGLEGSKEFCGRHRLSIRTTAKAVQGNRISCGSELSPRSNLALGRLVSWKERWLDGCVVLLGVGCWLVRLSAYPLSSYFWFHFFNLRAKTTTSKNVIQKGKNNKNR